MRPTLQADMTRFLTGVRSRGTVGNLSLRAELGWQEARYWKVRDALVDSGKIAIGRGRGGSVAVVPARKQRASASA